MITKHCPFCERHTNKIIAEGHIQFVDKSDKFANWCNYGVITKCSYCGQIFVQDLD